MKDDPIDSARAALTECEAIVDRLHKMCCAPRRSPSIIAIKESIASARHDLEGHAPDADAVDSSIATVTDIGSEIGRLQIGCCAPARMPLYADALTHLMTVQRSLKRSIGRGH